MSRNGYTAAAVVCLVLGLCDLGLLNVELAPRAFPPIPEKEVAPSEAPAAKASPREGRPPSEAKKEPEPSVEAKKEPEPSVETKKEPEPAVEAKKEPEPAVEARKVPEPRSPQTPRAPRSTAMIHFSTGDSQLLPQAKAALERLAEKLKADPLLRVQIDGHADQRGEEDRNAVLSRLRAKSVADFLMEAGIERSRITTRGLGSTSLLDENNTPEAWAKNRRAEIRVWKGKP
jgi:outer membrane protein OmpA-like peptidoglycan-associated protein